MSYVTVTDVECDDRALRVFIESLVKETGIVSITLRTRFLSNSTARIVARLIAFSSDLRELDLSDNNIEAEGYKAIADSIAVNTSLCVLNLSNNPILIHERAQVDEYFRSALRSSKHRPENSRWCLYHKEVVDDFERLKASLF